MSQIKRFIVRHNWNNDMEVSLEADFSILTYERANEINSFWAGDEDRVHRQNNHLQEAVVRLFGQRMINEMLAEGGADFNAKNEEAGAIWSRQLRSREGWGEEEGSALYGWCGIRVVAAEVKGASYDDLELKEVIA